METAEGKKKDAKFLYTKSIITQKDDRRRGPKEKNKKRFATMRGDCRSLDGDNVRIEPSPPPRAHVSPPALSICCENCHAYSTFLHCT
jgi:hypothetical protein